MLTLIIILAYFNAPKDNKPDLEKLGCLPVILLLIDASIIKIICASFGVDFII